MLRFRDKEKWKTKMTLDSYETAYLDNFNPLRAIDFGRKAFFLNDRINISYPCLVYAFIKKEFSETTDAIPYDIIEFKSSLDIKALSLKVDADYTVFVQNIKNEEQRFDIKR